jgi:hypothetical protein
MFFSAINKSGPAAEQQTRTMTIKSHYVPSQPRRTALKENFRSKRRLVALMLTAAAPLRAVMQDPVSQGPFEANIMTGLFRLDPFVPQNFFPLGLELTVE